MSLFDRINTGDALLEAEWYTVTRATHLAELKKYISLMQKVVRQLRTADSSLSDARALAGSHNRSFEKDDPMKQGWDNLLSMAHSGQLRNLRHEVERAIESANKATATVKATKTKKTKP